MINEKEIDMSNNYNGPIIWASIEPYCKEDYARLSTSAWLVGERDNSLVIKYIHPEKAKVKYPNGVILVNAMGELHLETAIAKIANTPQINVDVSKPQIFYLEDESGVTLEPIMTLNIETPVDCYTRIANDLEENGANICIDHLRCDRENKYFTTKVPLSGVLGYPIRLRKLSDGKAISYMAFSHYAPCEPKEEFEPPLDEDIKVYVETLRAGGIETYESCQGGEGHSYLRPAVRFHGGKGEGFRALAIAQQHGFRVRRLNRMWSIIDDEPTGPYWEMVFWDHK